MRGQIKFSQRIAALTSSPMRLIQIAALCLLSATWAAAQSDSAQPHCIHLGGSILTNFVEANTTLGTATGDLRGAVSATLLGIAPGPNGTTVFTVQHHLVTETGDTIAVDRAQATAAEVAPGLFGIVSYPVKIVGGTGKFEGATGSIENIGEVDLNTQRTVFRYRGNVCFRAPAR